MTAALMTIAAAEANLAGTRVAAAGTAMAMAATAVRRRDIRTPDRSTEAVIRVSRPDGVNRSRL
jgi:hypothetical protein